MADDQRRGGHLQRLVEAGLRHVRQVDDHPQAVHLADHVHAEAGQATAGAVLPDAIAEFIAQVPGGLHRTHAQAVEVAQLREATLQGLAAFEVQDEFHVIVQARGRQVATGLHQREAAARCGHLLQELVEVVERALEESPRVLRVCPRVAADRIDRQVDPVADQPGHDRIGEGAGLAHQRPVHLLVDVAMAFYDQVPLQDRRGFGFGHGHGLPSLRFATLPTRGSGRVACSPRATAGGRRPRDWLRGSSGIRG